ncbi:MAG: coniferyl aldehyde dehydrogenase [Nevskia sp.]|nr:coniferyl aldehyde dehydrogenase [Nevskia sp.]
MNSPASLRLPAAEPSAADPLADLFARQRAAFAAGDAAPCAERIEWLNLLEQALLRRRYELAQAISADFHGRAVEETLMLEVFGLVDEIRHTRHQLRRWMKPRRVASNWQFWPSRSSIRYQPLGVVGVMGAFNYPLYVALSPAIGALAAGNHVLVKPSELAPRCGEVMTELVSGVLPAERIAVVSGGLELSKAFAALPFDHLIFTGSPGVGRHILRAAADNLTPVTLELGGKSPAILDQRYPMARAAEAIVHAKLLNAGQTCVAPDYVLVPQARRQEFLDCARAAGERFYPSLAANPHYTRIISEREYQRLQGWLDEAREQGAKADIVNPAGESCDVTNRVFPFTLVWDCPPSARLLRDEIFGPILPVLGYDSLDAAIAGINRGERPLALYLFSDDHTTREHVLRRTISGGVTLNGCIYHVAQHRLPLGGVGNSGMGRYHGFDGFETFSRKKPIFHLSRWTNLALMRPPYGRAFQWLLGTLLRGRLAREVLPHRGGGADHG